MLVLSFFAERGGHDITASVTGSHIQKSSCNISTQLHLRNSRLTTFILLHWGILQGGFSHNSSPPLPGILLFLKHTSQRCHHHRWGAQRPPALRPLRKQPEPALSHAGQPWLLLRGRLSSPPCCQHMDTEHKHSSWKQKHPLLKANPASGASQAVFPLPSPGRGARQAEGCSAAPLPHFHTWIHLSDSFATTQTNQAGSIHLSGPRPYQGQRARPGNPRNSPQ